MSEHLSLVIPGLSDDKSLMGPYTKLWPKNMNGTSIHPVVVPFGFTEKRPYEEKVRDLSNSAENLLTRSGAESLSIVGVSGGASAGIVLIQELINRGVPVTAFVNVCGRLARAGNPSLEDAARGRYGFIESVQYAEQILTQPEFLAFLHALTFGSPNDRVVPPIAMRIQNVPHVEVPSLGVNPIVHTTSIAKVMTLPQYTRRIGNHITQPRR
jgi:hypothetical protein